MIEKMTAALNVYEAMFAYHNTPTDKIKELSQSHKHSWDIVQHVLELRKHGGNAT